jgi:ABC-type sugar transport system substrate-binding protein
LLEWSPAIARIEEFADAIPDGKERVSVASNADVPTRLTEQWVAEHRRLPLCGVMANGADFY